MELKSFTYFSSMIQPIEKVCIRPDLKKVPQHTHVQRLTEPTRTREKIDLSKTVKKLLYEFRLIDIVIPLRAYLFKVFYPNR